MGKARGVRKARKPAAVARISRDLEALLLAQQKRAAAPPGMEKCPVCGAPVAPTRTQAVRVHDNPVKGTRCPASKRPWSEFRAPRKRSARRAKA